MLVSQLFSSALLLTYRCSEFHDGIRCQNRIKTKKSPVGSASTTTPIIIGVVVVICLLLGVVLFVVVRRKRWVKINIYRHFKYFHGSTRDLRSEIIFVYGNLCYLLQPSIKKRERERKEGIVLVFTHKALI